MGDADGDIIVPDQEVDWWMDEALEVVDEGLDFLLTYMININNRTKQIMIKLKVLDSYRFLFLAMNLLIMPVIISILICYSTRNIFHDSGYEDMLQWAVSFLMIVSGAIGLPWYLFSLWQSFRFTQKLNEDIKNIRRFVPRLESFQIDNENSSDDSVLTMELSELSSERLSQFQRVFANVVVPTGSDGIPRGNFTQQSGESEEHRSIPAERNMSSEAFSVILEDKKQNENECVENKESKLGIQNCKSVPTNGSTSSFGFSNLDQDEKKIDKLFGKSHNIPVDNDIICSDLEEDIKSVKEKLECIDAINASLNEVSY